MIMLIHKITSHLFHIQSRNNLKIKRKLTSNVTFTMTSNINHMNAACNMVLPINFNMQLLYNVFLDKQLMSDCLDILCSDPEENSWVIPWRLRRSGITPMNFPTGSYIIYLSNETESVNPKYHYMIIVSFFKRLFSELIL